MHVYEILLMDYQRLKIIIILWLHINVNIYRFEPAYGLNWDFEWCVQFIWDLEKQTEYEIFSS